MVGRMPLVSRRVREKWQRDGLPVRPGVTELDIKRFEACHNVVMADEVKRFFTVVDGVEEWNVDDQLLWFRPLNKVVPMSDCYPLEVSESADGRWFLLVDHCIGSWYFAVLMRCEQRTSSPVLQTLDQKIVANSLLEFLEVYLRDPESLLL